MKPKLLIPFVEEVRHNGVPYIVVRDDLVNGGTKAAVLPRLFNDHIEYVYPSPVQGYAQIALAVACRAYDRKATVVCAARNRKHPRTERTIELGATVLEVRPGYLSVVRKRAEEYCERTGACLLPWGLDCDEMVKGVADRAKQTGLTPKEVWCVAGSGTLTRGLQLAWPNAKHYAVQVGATPNHGNATLLKADEKYEENARRPPPYPACGNYDAKLWRFVVSKAVRPAALIWNVAGD